MLNGLQLIALFFALAISYFAFLNFKRGQFTIREFIGWELIWLCFAGVTLFPQEFEVYSTLFGAMRPMDLFTILGFMVTLSIAFYTYTNLDKVRKQMEKTIRDLALQEIKKK